MEYNGSKMWKIAKEERRKIEAFEVWCCRRMIEISWTDMVTNKDNTRKNVREKNYNMEFGIKKRRNQWIGRVLRHG